MKNQKTTMSLYPSKKYKELFTSKVTYTILMGGRASGRSYHASQYALQHLITDDYFRCAIMRFVLGDIRNSIFQEIRDRIEENRLESQIDIKENTLEFVYGKNKINGIGFRKSSGDQKSKLKSLANYNCIIIEEGDEVSEEDFQQLDDSLRTLKAPIKVIICLNPPDKNHWIIKRWFNLLPSGVEGFYRAELKASEKDTLFIHGTYRDNAKNLPEKKKANFLRYKETKPDHYYNMIEGLVSEGAKGRIYTKWKPIPDDEFYELADIPSYFGLDFGFSNDPTALVEIKEHNNKIYLRELLYETGLTNQMIASRLRDFNIDYETIYADSAEPKSIEEIKREGFNIVECIKGQGSLNAGIDVLIDKDIYYTEGSKHIALETQNYKWKLNKNKEPMNVPEDANNHLMDAVRYGVYTSNKKKLIGFI